MHHSDSNGFPGTENPLPALGPSKTKQGRQFWKITYQEEKTPRMELRVQGPGGLSEQHNSVLHPQRTQGSRERRLAAHRAGLGSRSRGRGPEHIGWLRGAPRARGGPRAEGSTTWEGMSPHTGQVQLHLPAPTCARTHMRHWSHCHPACMSLSVHVTPLESLPVTM